MTKLQEFSEFLKTVDLQSYRRRYSKIKIVEMDLPKPIQAIALLYRVYWVERNFLTFEAFYKRYLSEHKTELEAFRVETTLCEPDFYRGLEARIYRTWAGLITQIHAGYVAEAVFGTGSVKMSAELDHQGADIRVEYKGRHINYQVKKTSYAGVRSSRPLSRRSKLDGENIDIFYEVPTNDIFTEPKKKSGDYKEAYKRFSYDKRLRRFDNGFVTFTELVFKVKKDEIDRSSK
jgi:hypothetical protein